MAGDVEEPWLEGDDWDDDDGDHTTRWLNDFPDSNSGSWLGEDNIYIYTGNEPMTMFTRIQAGSGKVLNYYVWDPSEMPLDLSNAKAEWTMSPYDGGTPVIAKYEGGGIQFPQVGLIQVTISPTETEGLSGRYKIECSATIGGQTVLSFIGDAMIAPSSVGTVQ